MFSPEIQKLLSAGRRKLAEIQRKEDELAAEIRAAEESAAEHHWYQLVVAVAKVIPPELIPHTNILERPALTLFRGEGSNATTGYRVVISVPGLEEIQVDFGFFSKEPAGVRRWVLNEREGCTYRVPTYSCSEGEVYQENHALWCHTDDIEEAVGYAEVSAIQREEMERQAECYRAERDARPIPFPQERTAERELADAVRRVISESTFAHTDEPEWSEEGEF